FGTSFILLALAISFLCEMDNLSLKLKNTAIGRIDTLKLLPLTAGSLNGRISGPIDTAMRTPCRDVTDERTREFVFAIDFGLLLIVGDVRFDSFDFLFRESHAANSCS